MILSANLKCIDVDDTASVLTARSFAIKNMLDSSSSIITLLMWQLYFPHNWKTMILSFVLYLLSVLSSIVGLGKIKFLEESDKMPD